MLDYCTLHACPGATSGSTIDTEREKKGCSVSWISLVLFGLCYLALFSLSLFYYYYIISFNVFNLSSLLCFSSSFIRVFLLFTYFPFFIVTTRISIITFLYLFIYASFLYLNPFFFHFLPCTFFIDSSPCPSFV